jgi:hypothetical protein
VLTKSGWKYYNEIEEGEVVIVYNDEEDITEDGIVLEKHFYKNTPLVRCTNSNTEIICTPNHRWFSKKRVNTKGNPHYSVNYTETLDLRTEDNIVVTAPYIGNPLCNITPDEAFLMGFLLSDGYYWWAEESTGPSTSYGKRRHVICSIAQSKNKFWREVEGCLSDLGIGYTKDTIEKENENPVYKYRLKSEDARTYLDKMLNDARTQKHETDWSSWVINLSRTSLKSFYSGFHLGDGYQGKKIISQKPGNICDAIIIASQLLGEGRVLVSGKNDICRCIRRARSNNLTWQKISVEDAGAEDTFCLTTTGNSFIIKQEGYIGITGNSAIYGVGKRKLARETGMSEAEAEELLSAYWAKNWAVTQVASDAEIRTFKNGMMWIKNPVSGFWYSLRYEKDAWSTLNQGTGVFCFDTWNAYLRQRYKVPMIAQFHDENISFTTDREDTTEKYWKACEDLNNHLKLNVPLSIDIKYGSCYAEIH